MCVRGRDRESETDTFIIRVKEQRKTTIQRGER